MEASPHRPRTHADIARARSIRTRSHTAASHAHAYSRFERARIQPLRTRTHTAASHARTDGRSPR
eukprot:5298884-Pleurochrysis_carterae.AAC.1